MANAQLPNVHQVWHLVGTVSGNCSFARWHSVVEGVWTLALEALALVPSSCVTVEYLIHLFDL